MNIFKKEKEVTELALEYLEVAEQCVSKGGKALSAYFDGDLEKAESAERETGHLETAADKLRRTIGDRLFSGAYLPLMRGDIFSVIDIFDKVPNAAEACCRFFLSQKPSIPAPFKPAFAELAAESFHSKDALGKAFKALFNPKGDIEKIRACAKEVGVHESKVDQQEWDLTAAIFGSEDIDLAQKLHLKQAVERIVRLSDVAENAADRLELVAMKSVF